MSAPDTAELRRMIRARHKETARWAVFDEVRNKTGYDRGPARYCDTVAISLWPSDGLEIHGYEIKTSRADFLNEIRDPDKSEPFRRHLDRWWVVVSSQKVAAAPDMPDDWGLLRPRGGRLVVSKGARSLSPEPMPRAMLASILRAAQSASPGPKALEAARKAGYDEGVEMAEDRSKWMYKGEISRIEGVEKAVADFEAASGVRIGRWRGEKMGRAFALAERVLAGVDDRAMAGMESRLRDALDAFGRAREDLRRITEPDGSEGGP